MEIFFLAVVTENIPDLGAQSDNSELLAEKKLSLKYTISNNSRNFPDCNISQRKYLLNDIGMELKKNEILNQQERKLPQV